MPKLSAVIITKNEEEKITACLDSLKGLADEVVVVDDCSRDRTAQLCEACGAKVLVHASGGNFDNQRNLGIEAATGEWILQMDADEIIPADTAKKIREAIADSTDRIAFKLKRRNFFLGHRLTYAGGCDYMTKLFRKDKARYVGANVHETLEVEGSLGELDSEINHYPFNSIAQVIKRWNFYTDIEARVFLEKKDKVSFKEIKYRLTIKSVKLFWKLYVKKRGYKDGMYGLIWCVLNVIGPQIKWLKIWELALKEKKLG